jgi:hypothetical protein
MRVLSVRLVGLIVLAAHAACALHGPPVPVTGRAGDLEQLAGEWSGVYVGDHDHRRRGTIAFNLQYGAEQAYGAVMMTPEGLGYPYQRARSAHTLTIRFVHAEGGTLVGALDTYWDPDRRSEATATFRGRFIDARTIEGTFMTRYASGTANTAGTWKVARQQARRGGGEN